MFEKSEKHLYSVNKLHSKISNIEAQRRGETCGTEHSVMCSSSKRALDSNEHLSGADQTIPIRFIPLSEFARADWLHQTYGTFSKAPLASILFLQ